MLLDVFPVGMLGCNCILVGDSGTKTAIVIDPGADASGIAAKLQRSGLKLDRILITHAHIDHIAGATSLQKLTGAPIFYNEHDLQLVKIMDVQAGWLGIATPEVNAPDGDIPHLAEIGASSVRMLALHTPGHTPGSVSLYMPEQRWLFAGDTLFAGSVGRTDLPGGDSRTLLRSIQSNLLVLPDDVRVIPGHGPETTIGVERRTNPFLRQL